MLLCGLAASQHGWAGQRFDLDGLQGELSIGAGAANIVSRGVNFGAGRMDLRDASNGGTRVDWQELYIKPESPSAMRWRRMWKCLAVRR